VETFLQAGARDQGQSGEIQLGKPTFLWAKAWRALKLPATHLIDPFRFMACRSTNRKYETNTIEENHEHYNDCTGN
jgi:hypothetical protein